MRAMNQCLQRRYQTFPFCAESGLSLLRHLWRPAVQVAPGNYLSSDTVVIEQISTNAKCRAINNASVRKT